MHEFFEAHPKGTKFVSAFLLPHLLGHAPVPDGLLTHPFGFQHCPNRLSDEGIAVFFHMLFLISKSYQSLS